MKSIDLADKLEPLGLFAGALLVVLAVGTVLGAPWETNNNVVASVIQFVGVAAMIAIGVGLARLSYVGDDSGGRT